MDKIEDIWSPDISRIICFVFEDYKKKELIKIKND